MSTRPFSSVLILTGCHHATVQLYRGVHLQEQLAHLGIQAELREWHDQPLPRALVGQFDLLVLQRTALSANLTRVIDVMHEQGKPVIFDTDDLVFEPTMIEWHRGAAQLPLEERLLNIEGVRRTLATLEASDAMLGASPLLVELARRRGKPAFLQRNAVGVEMQALGDRLYAHRRIQSAAVTAGRQSSALPLPPLSADATRRHSGEIIIGYGSGTHTHDVDFAEVVPALVDLLARHPNVELWLMGPLTTPAALDFFRARIRRFPLTGWQAYLALASGLDIMLAPLEANNLFCRAKSEIKFVEAGLLGIPVAATRIDPFEAVIEPGHNGFLAGNTTEWIAALDTLITQPELRTQIGDAARQTVIQCYTLPTRAAALAETLAKVPTTQPPLRAAREQSSEAVTQDETGRFAKNMLTPVKSAPSPESALTADQAGTSTLLAPSLVLNWLVTEPFRGSGGHLGVFRMIQYLVEFGHECHVYVKPIEQMLNWPAEQMRDFVDQQIVRTGAHFHRWMGRTGAADATIATYWSTVDDVLQLPDTGRRYYFVQDFEPFFYPVGSEYIQAENTYRQGFHCLTLGPWLAKLMAERYGAQADHFDFAVDTEIYWPQALPRASHPRVAFYARPTTPRRAYELGIAALSLVKRQHPAVEVVLFGANELPPPPFLANILGVRHPYELAALYSTCDVGMVLSLTNPSFVPFEMMACKCAVVDLRSERVEGLLADRQTALLADPTPESIAEAILELLWDTELRTAIVDRAYAQTRHLSWQNSARQIERIFLAHAPPAERRLTRRVREEDADSLLWQIHQLLDQRRDHTAQTTQLEALLQRTLAEKAVLAEQLRQTEAALRMRQGKSVGLAWRLSNKSLSEAPTWILGRQLLSKLLIGEEAIQQEFIAISAKLCRIELCFAPYKPLATGALRIALHDLAQPERPVVERTLQATEIAVDRPVVLAFAPQLYSQGRIYRLTLMAVDEVTFAHALWRYWAATTVGAHLQRGGHPLRGQLLFTLGYDEDKPASAAIPPVVWVQTPQPLSTVAYAAGASSVRESSRLAAQTWRVLRTRGPLQLPGEFWSYLRWQVGKWLKP